MTRAVYQSMFIFLSALLFAALFVVQPTDNKDLQAFQSDVRTQFSQAATEVFGDADYSEPFAFVWTAIENFYSESADQTIALLQPDDAFMDLALMFDSDYIFNQEIAQMPIAFRTATEEPLYNIIPMSDTELLLDPNFNEDLAYSEEFGGVVAGDSIDINGPIPEQPAIWQTINDSITGEPYCVAVFFGTVNTYPGACAVEEKHVIYAN